MPTLYIEVLIHLDPKFLESNNTKIYQHMAYGRPGANAHGKVLNARLQTP